MHLSRNRPVGNKTNLHLELPGFHSASRHKGGSAPPGEHSTIENEGIAGKKLGWAKLQRIGYLPRAERPNEPRKVRARSTVMVEGNHFQGSVDGGFLTVV